MQTASTINKRSHNKRRKHKKKQQLPASQQINQQNPDSKPAPLSLKKEHSKTNIGEEFPGDDSSDFSNQEGSEGSYSMSDDSSDNSGKGQKLRLSDFDQDDDQLIIPPKSPAVQNDEIVFPTKDAISLNDSQRMAMQQQIGNHRNDERANQMYLTSSVEEFRLYDGYQPSLVLNKNDQAIQDLLVHSESKEKRLKKLQELKKAKFQLLEEEIQLEAKRLKEAKLAEKQRQKNMKSNGKSSIRINDNYMDSEFVANQAVEPEIDEETRKKMEEDELFQKENKKLKDKFVKTLSSGSKYNPDVENQINLEKYANVSIVTEREWRKLVGMYNTIYEFDPLQIVSKERVRKSLLVGIPHSLRGEIWCMLCRVQREKAMHSPEIYQKLIDLDNPEEEHRIQKDVTRTFTNYPMTNDQVDSSWDTVKGQDMLFNVLLAFANYDSQIGYVQGLNYIAAMLLMHIQDEEKVFWCLIYLLNRKNWRRIYTEDMPKLMELIDEVEQRLITDYPNVEKHLKECDFTIGAAFSPIFITLYIYQIDHQYAMRIFEMFILDGEQALLRVLYRMLDLKGDKICSLREVELMIFLRTDIINECIAEHGIASLLDGKNL